MGICTVCGSTLLQQVDPSLCPRCARLVRLMESPGGLDAARKIIDIYDRPPWEPLQHATLERSKKHDSLVADGRISAELDAKIYDERADTKIFMNNRYQVAVTESKNINGDVAYCLSIKNLDKSARHDWRDFQRIKNDILGFEAEAVEIYPAESRLVDTANQFFLWCAIGLKIPFGFNERLVATDDFAEEFGARQRPFEPDQVPPDAVKLSPEKLEELYQQGVNRIKKE